MATCTLRIGDRVVLASAGGVPEVEYLLFDPSEVEIAGTGRGAVQEVGYQTTAQEAIGRLRTAGFTLPLLVECTSAMQPTLAIAYARGAAVRRIATALGPAELFEGLRHDAATKVYDGRWVDLPALCVDVGDALLGHTLQGLYLLSLLREVSPDDPVRLVTREVMAAGRAGSRSYHRHTPAPTSAVPPALRALAAMVRESLPGDDTDRSEGPSADEMLEILGDRAAFSSDPESQDRLEALEKAIEVRTRPAAGPLADPEAWALDERLSSGRADGVVELVATLEQSRGRQPATEYLRARAAFVAGREPPRAIAERVAALALAMPAFVELQLLATEAWNAAGEPSRALLFASDLLSGANAGQEIRLPPSQPVSLDAGKGPMSRAPVSLPPMSRGPASQAPASKAAASKGPVSRAPASLSPSSQAPASPSVASLAPGSQAPGSKAAVARRPVSMAPGSQSPASQAPVSRTLESKGQASKGSASKAGAPAPEAHEETKVPSSRAPASPPAAERKDRTSDAPTLYVVSSPLSQVPRSPAVPSAVAQEQRAPEKRAKSEPTLYAPSGAAVPSAIAAEKRAPEKRAKSEPTLYAPSAADRPSTPSSSSARRMANLDAEALMRGASQPPFRRDSPDSHVHIPRAAPVPRIDTGAEQAAVFALPDGLRGFPSPVETLPKNFLDARVQFTFQARELGLDYEERLGITLTADLSGLEAIQRALPERFPARAVTTLEEAADLRRHGAFLSEVLARTFGAFWVDVAPSDIGYWAMLVPPDTRVWPFGWLLRLIAGEQKDQDLVSYFRELEKRAAAKR